MTTAPKGKLQQRPPHHLTKIAWPHGNLLFVTLDFGGFGGSFNTLRNATFFSAAPQDAVNTGQVDWVAVNPDHPDPDKPIKGVKIKAYESGALEFYSRMEFVVFEVPNGAWRIDLKGFNPQLGNATAAVYRTKAKGFSKYEGEVLTGAVGGIGDFSEPREISDSHPPEIDDSTASWTGPSAFVVPPGAELVPETIAGMVYQYGVNFDGSTHGTYAEFIAESKRKEKTDRAWTRATKFYKPGAVDGYATVIKYGEGLDTSTNGADVPFTLYITFKDGKLNISNTPPTPPPPPLP